jgi:PAS domain S-box-containing protein
MNLFKTLHAKLLALTITILSFAVVFITVTNILNFSVSYKQALEERSITVAENIRSTIYKNLKYFPLDGFTGMPLFLQDVLANNPGLSYCYIADTGRHILYHSDINFTRADQKVQASAYSFLGKNTRGETVLTDQYYESIIPIIYESDYLGTIHVGVEKKIIGQKILSMVWQNALIFFIFLALAIFVLYKLVTRHITRPIDLLVEHAIDIAKHKDVAGTIPISSEDEVGKLASAFNEMKVSLDSYIKELNYRNDALHTINVIADRLYRSFDLATIAKDAVESLAFYSNSPRAILFEIDEENRILKRIYAHGFSEEALNVSSILPLEGSFSGITAKTKQVKSILDIAGDDTIVPQVRQALVGDGLNKGISIPLLFQDKVLGVLNLLFTSQNRGELEEYERETLLSLGKTIGLAMANARHVDQIKNEISERKRTEDFLQESEVKHRTLFEATSDAIAIYRENKITDCNKAFLEVFHATRDQVIGHKAKDFLPQYQPDGHSSKQYIKETVRAVLNGERISMEALYLRCDGTTFDGELTFDAIKIKGVMYYQTIIRDITQRKQVEAEVKKLNAELEQRVIERTKDLEFANKELESFSYTISHDLRAPLRSIDGFSRILMEDFSAQLSAEAFRYLQLVRTNTQQMGKLIIDILAFSRMSRQPISKQEVRPLSIIHQVLEELQSMQEGRKMNIVIGDMPPCQADPSLLKIVYTNLLSNALKFTRTKEEACIEIGCKTNGKDIYYIKDNGVGFDMKYVDKIFGVFQRLHRPEEFEGTGCGTAIVQRIITRHGGQIWVEAKINVGTTFFFTLE